MFLHLYAVGYSHFYGNRCVLIVIHEVMAANLAIYRQRGEEQHDADPEIKARGTGSNFAALAKFAACPRIAVFATHYTTGARRC